MCRGQFKWIDSPQILMISLYIYIHVFFDFLDILTHTCMKVTYNNGLCEVFFNSCTA